ncbi:2'-5' RNA ligase family protein [Legionella quinlivanii]|nr:2'-5' RNA ligase family protein [Legionella quinlivanii]MCW8450803.1 2'-5' RNA ligase family protein [Legionella quinlivanii]
MLNLIFKIVSIGVVFLASMSGYAAEQISLSKTIYVNSSLPFESHQGAGPFDTAIAMNIQYQPVKTIREELSSYLQYPLRFFTGWNEDGEAHITVITPPEYSDIIKKFVSIERMEEIALQNTIQASDLKVLGLGRGVVNINDKAEETYFLIVKSRNLLKIRQLVYEEFVKNGGNKDAWNPRHFHPHITVGYSLRDLHEADGVIKDVMHSLDTRFELVSTE